MENRLCRYCQTPHDPNTTLCKHNPTYGEVRMKAPLASRYPATMTFAEVRAVADLRDVLISALACLEAPENGVADPAAAAHLLRSALDRVTTGGPSARPTTELTKSVARRAERQLAHHDGKHCDRWHDGNPDGDMRLCSCQMPSDQELIDNLVVAAQEEGQAAAPYGPGALYAKRKASRETYQTALASTLRETREKVELREKELGRYKIDAKLRDTRSNIYTQALIEVLRDFVDDDPCHQDHQGYCQTHGWLSKGDCLMTRARNLLSQGQP